MPDLTELISSGDLAGVQRAVQKDPSSVNEVALGARTPLMWALDPESGGHDDIARWLIEHGADLDLQDENGATALNYACCFDHPDTAQKLIEHGANVNLFDNTRTTPLMTACAEVYSPATLEGTLRCAKVCYAGGADMYLKRVDHKDVLTIAIEENRADAVAFLEFVSASEVAQILLDDLQQPRSLAVAFYDAGLLTLEACAALDDADVDALGVQSPQQRQSLTRRFARGPAQPPRRSLSRRVSQGARQLVRRPLSNAHQYDAYLANDWGAEHVHREVVAAVNLLLVEEGKATWHVPRLMPDANIAQQVASAIKASRKVVVFITKTYMKKLNSDDENYCKMEFLTAVRVRTVRNMIPVVIDASMLDRSSWSGPLQLELGGEICIDFTSLGKRINDLPRLLERIDA